MGNSAKEAVASEAYWANERKKELAAERKVRMILAEKIVMVVVDKIIAEIVRPGPVWEERECYIMAKELRDDSPNLAKLVSEIIRVDEKERDV